ncbi:50S ribosomal protein L1 [Candidatus Peregrinibacteria bacterium]|nr:50S ribosomal protein L1 [Candidatus Peregrinibacteria bacterium]
MSHKGKKYNAAKELLKDKQLYSIDEAIPLLLKTNTTKFDASCEIHIKLGIDPKHADQAVRATISLPHGTGKKVKVIAFVSDEKVAEAKKAGAIEAGSAELIEKIIGGWLDFDVAVATPGMMKEIGKIAKILGQKGLMPNPKSGTVTDKIEQVVSEIMKGKIEFRNDKLSNLHNIFGKISFGEAALKENLQTYIKAVQDAKPAGAKGVYIQSITICTTMGPGIHLELK